MQAFAGKGRMQTLLESMPVMVITNDGVEPLLGAAAAPKPRSRVRRTVCCHYPKFVFLKTRKNSLKRLPPSSSLRRPRPCAHVEGLQLHCLAVPRQRDSTPCWQPRGIALPGTRSFSSGATSVMCRRMPKANYRHGKGSHVIESFRAGGDLRMHGEEKDAAMPRSNTKKRC